MLNAILPPLVAALRLPFTVAIGFLLVLALDAAMLLWAADIAPDAIDLSGFGSAFAVSLIASALSAAIGTVVGIDDDASYTLQMPKWSRRDVTSASRRKRWRSADPCNSTAPRCSTFSATRRASSTCSAR